jgi:cyclase
MLRPRVIPCLLLKNKRLVKTKKFKNPIYIGDPINAVKIFNEKETDELVFIDIEANETGPDFELIQEITTECFMPFAYGGGIKSMTDINRLFSLGVEKVILGEAALLNPYLVQKAVEQYGSQSIVGIMDVKIQWWSKKKFIYTRKGKQNTYKSPIDYAKHLESLGVGEIIMQVIDLEGSRNGYDLGLINQVSNELNIPLIALGGCGNKTHIQEGLIAGASGVAAGTFFTLREPHDAVLITYLKNEEIIQLL